MSKQKVAIVTDASGDIPPELEDKYNITILPILMNFEEESFKSEGIEKGFTWDEFYKIAEKEVPSTGIPGPGVFMKTFNKALEIADSVIGIFISNKLSGVYNTATMVAKQHMPDNDISIYHAGVNSVGVGVVVVEAARLASAGHAKADVCTKVENWIKKVNYAGIINQLENLVRTGRLSKTKKFFANILKYKPVLGFVDDEIHVYGNIKADDALIIKQMKKFGEQALQNMVEDNNTIFLAHSRWPEAAEEIVAYLNTVNPKKKEIIIQETGVINAFYTGKKLLAFGYIGKFDSNWLMDTK
ncbi:MAG: DegV family protein [Candidatus Heimdallarchaeota archaeon]|nr:DegV family protein [Candidatus Heimdallarchaeota archaeon]MCK4291486.1 DegV family protein [Candidatus Heimdallarchaeota archaeon]